MPLVLILVFIVLPLAELYVIIQVGDLIGIVPTLLLLLADGFLGAALARSQGRAAWRRFNEAIAAGRVPAKEVFDGAAIILGGALLLSPGFISDALGVLLLLPPTRAMLRRMIVGTARRVGPVRPVFFLYDRHAARTGSAEEARRRAQGSRGGRGAGSPPPWPPGAGQAPGKPYDIDGSAREIPDDAPELGDGHDERRAG